MIEATNLSKVYGEMKAVKGLTFSFGASQVIGLLGPNGAGKTTTMRMLTTFLPPSEGTAKVAGFDIISQADEVRKQIGYLPETPPLYQELSVKEYLTYVGRLKGVSRKDIKERLDETLSRTHLTHMRNKLCGHLSKGYRQRVGIAQAIIHNPAVIILDEPTSGLDPVQILEVRTLIRELGKNHTVILSTHILPEVSETCSQVLMIVDGVIAHQGAINELCKSTTLEKLFIDAVANDSRMSEES